MRRFLLVLVPIILLILDNSLMPFLGIKGVYPNLLFIFAISYSIINGKEKGIYIGAYTGLLQDIFFFSGFGVNALVNMFCCLFAGVIGDGIWRDKKLIPIFTMLFSTIIRVFGIFVIMYLLDVKVDVLRGISAGLYNSIIMFFAYPLLYKFLYDDKEKTNWRFKW